MENQKIIVTGSMSFIGLNLIKRIKDKNEIHAVVHKQKPTTTQKEILSNTTVHRIDITSENISELIQQIKPDIIFHLAAYSNANRDEQHLIPAIKANIEGISNLLKATINTNLKRFVNISSSEVYGPSETRFVETQKLNPVSPYGITKATAENICNFYYNTYNVPIVNIRPIMVYGEYQSENKIIPFLIKSCKENENINMTSGTQTRDFLYVEDLIEALIKAATKPVEGETINIGTTHEISIKELALKIKGLTNSKSQINFGVIPTKNNEIMRMHIDITKAKTLLSWEPTTSLDAGLKKLYNLKFG